MSSSERDGRNPEQERRRQKGRSPPERSQNPEREPQLYLQVAYFANEHVAGHAYEQTQELLYSGPPNVLSSYRLMLDEKWHVAVLGEQPPVELDQLLQEVFGQGIPAPLPEDVVTVLQDRRREATKVGSWVECHHRPGIRLTRPEGSKS